MRHERGKHRVSRAKRLRRVRNVRCLRSIFCIVSFPTECCACGRYSVEVQGMDCCSREFARLFGARANFGYFITPSVTKIVKFRVCSTITDNYAARLRWRTCSVTVRLAFWESRSMSRAMRL
jgi:hypothetical protein